VPPDGTPILSNIFVKKCIDSIQWSVYHHYR
jgi:hypothetical protein